MSLNPSGIRDGMLKSGMEEDTPGVMDRLAALVEKD